MRYPTAGGQRRAARSHVATRWQPQPQPQPLPWRSHKKDKPFPACLFCIVARLTALVYVRRVQQVAQEIHQELVHLHVLPRNVVRAGEFRCDIDDFGVVI